MGEVEADGSLYIEGEEHEDSLAAILDVPPIDEARWYPPDDVEGPTWRVVGLVVCEVARVSLRPLRGRDEVDGCDLARLAS